MAERDRMLIALIDDDAIDRMLMHKALQGVTAAMDIVEYSDGATALSAMRETPPSAVLIDVHMPDMGGFEVVRAIRADPTLFGLPIVMLSDSNEREKMLHSRELGATAYFPKPDTIKGYEVLAKALRREWLDQPSARSRSLALSNGDSGTTVAL